MDKKFRYVHRKDKVRKRQVSYGCILLKFYFTFLKHLEIFISYHSKLFTYSKDLRNNSVVLGSCLVWSVKIVFYLIQSLFIILFF